MSCTALARSNIEEDIFPSVRPSTKCTRTNCLLLVCVYFQAHGRFRTRDLDFLYEHAFATEKKSVVKIETCTDTSKINRKTYPLIDRALTR